MLDLPSCKSFVRSLLILFPRTQENRSISQPAEIIKSIFIYIGNYGDTTKLRQIIRQLNPSTGYVYIHLSRN